MWRWVSFLGVGCASGPDFTDEAPAVDDPSCVVGLAVGECPPEFTLSAVAGGSLSLSEFVGQRVIVIGTSNW